MTTIWNFIRALVTAPDVVHWIKKYEAAKAELKRAKLTERDGWMQQGYCIINKSGVMYWNEEFCVASDKSELTCVMDELNYDNPEEGWHLEPFYIAAAPKNENLDD